MTFNETPSNSDNSSNSDCSHSSLDQKSPSNAKNLSGTENLNSDVKKASIKRMSKKTAKSMSQDMKLQVMNGKILPMD